MKKKSLTVIIDNIVMNGNLSLKLTQKSQRILLHLLFVFLSLSFCVQ